MNWTLETIIERLRQGPVGPHDVADMITYCVGEYSYWATLFDQIQEGKPQKWLDLREISKSASETDKRWDATPEGLEEGKLRRKLKIYEKLLSSLKARLRVAEIESRGI